jgi:hypothetical protein
MILMLVLIKALDRLPLSGVVEAHAEPIAS